MDLKQIKYSAFTQTSRSTVKRKENVEKQANRLANGAYANLKI